MREEATLTTLGSLGWIPTRHRQTCCFCLEYNGVLIILDAGTGAARFSEPLGQSIADKYNKVYLILSHYHLDHTVGLIYLPHIFKDKEFHIVAPGKYFYGESVKHTLSKLIVPPYFSVPLTQFPMNLEFHDLGTGTISFDEFLLESIQQKHSDPSAGIKIDDTLCYITDTPCSAKTIEFAKGCNILLHEAWIDHNDFKDYSAQANHDPSAEKVLKSHSHITGVANIASKAGVNSLMLIHLNPFYSETQLQHMEEYAQKLFPNSFLAIDNRSVSFKKKNRSYRYE
jgi:ribonuclease BN (tRNA processing enzyme)